MMRPKILFLAKYALFWILLSAIAKILFLLYEKSGSLTVADYGGIFYHMLPMDISLGAYILMAACVIFAFTPFLQERLVKTILAVFSGILICLFWLIVVADLELFRNWGYHMDASVLTYLKTPGEAMASTPGYLIFLLTLLWLVLSVAALYLYCRCIARPFHYRPGHWWQAPVFLILAGLMIIPVRGGFNVAPMNSSFVFFHKTNMFANQAAINPVWNFMYEAMHAGKTGKRFHYMPSEEARQLVDSLYRPDGKYPHILKTSRPNIVVLLLESFTANAIGVLGGEKGVTPNLNQIAREGVLFSNIYAAGNRSDRGMAGVISAYPNYPGYSLLKYPNKTAERPRFPKDLEENGYHTRYYYAGDINFGSFRSYITMSFQEMVTEDDFSGEAKANRFKWGIHDGYMFDRLYEDVSKARQPFMYMAFNMSSHEPFEVPMETKIKGNTEDRKFMNAVVYSDSCIGNFVQKCKDSGLWDDMLLVMIADHGTAKIGDLEPYAPKAYHIPMIFSGGALNVRDTVVTTIGSQIDMAATLLAQLGLEHTAYKYSKNLLSDQVVPFAFYAYPNAVGMVSPNGVSIFDLKGQRYIEQDTAGNMDRRLKAYLQVLDEDLNAKK